MCQTLSCNYWFNSQHVALAWPRPLRKSPKCSSENNLRSEIGHRAAGFVVPLGLRTSEQSLYQSDELT